MGIIPALAQSGKSASLARMKATSLFTKAVATDDLTLTFGGVSGGFGGAIFSGYTVTAIPEPSGMVLIHHAGMAFFLRQRHQ